VLLCLPAVKLVTPALALQAAHKAGLERLDAQILLGHVLKRSRSWLLVHSDEVLSAEANLSWQSALTRHAQGEPLAYIMGEQGFYGLTLAVNPSVLVPRPDTEVLVNWAVELLTHTEVQAMPRVVDLGTGSGAIACAVKHTCPQAQVLATDVSADALAVAQGNAQRLGLTVTFCLSAWWDTLQSATFDLVLSNPPYIAEGDVHLAALEHEPTLALTSGADGLDALRQITAGAAHHLQPGGWLLLEHGYDQAEAVQALLHTQGLQHVETRRDLGGRARCTGARRLKSHIPNTSKSNHHE
jgi:release factor glutamine methyltransferase